MKRILAAVDAGPVAYAVIETAELLLPILADRLEVVTAGLDLPAVDIQTGHPIVQLSGPAEQAILAEANSNDVAATVVGLRSVIGGPRPAGHITHRLIIDCINPVVVVPPQLERDRNLAAAVLFPIEGGTAPGEHASSVVREFERRGCTVTPVHVFDRASAPRFWDRNRDLSIYTEQFADQFSPVRSMIELRAGDTANQILDAAEACRASLIVLEWKQQLDARRAPVIRRLLDSSPVPLMLIPAPEDDQPAGDCR